MRDALEKELKRVLDYVELELDIIEQLDLDPEEG
jgi:hypothetical protein